MSGTNSIMITRSKLQRDACRCSICRTRKRRKWRRQPPKQTASFFISGQRALQPRPGKSATRNQWGISIGRSKKASARKYGSGMKKSTTQYFWLIALSVAIEAAWAADLEILRPRVPLDQIASARAMANPLPATPEEVEKGK